MLLPWLCSTSTCRSFVKIFSAPNLFFGIGLLLSRLSSLNLPGSENTGQVNGEERLLIEENDDCALRSKRNIEAEFCFLAMPSNIVKKCCDHSMNNERRILVRNAVWRSA
jgi:hypothetical protein